MKDKICEYITGNPRWGYVGSVQKYEGNTAMMSVQTEDTYPLFGPCHKKLMIRVFCIDKNG